MSLFKNNKEERELTDFEKKAERYNYLNESIADFNTEIMNMKNILTYMAKYDTIITIRSSVDRMNFRLAGPTKVIMTIVLKETIETYNNKIKEVEEELEELINE